MRVRSPSFHECRDLLSVGLCSLAVHCCIRFHALYTAAVGFTYYLPFTKRMGKGANSSVPIGQLSFNGETLLVEILG